jgi:hypothetical protein
VTDRLRGLMDECMAKFGGVPWELHQLDDAEAAELLARALERGTELGQSDFGVPDGVVT